MQFVPGGPHDGFTITASDDVKAGGSEVQGELGSGQFFAVALYLGAGGHWLCPRDAREVTEARGPGVVSSLCYSDEESGPCRVALTISRPSGSSSSGRGRSSLSDSAVHLERDGKPATPFERAGHHIIV